MTTLPSISWLIPCHVPSAQLVEAVQSCLNQDFTDFEIIIAINGARIQEIKELIDINFPNESRVVQISTDIRYITTSLNLGIHIAKGKYIARLDADDIALPARLSLQYSFMENHPEVDVLGTHYDIIDDNNQKIDTRRLPETNKDIRRALLWSNPICHPSVMIRRQILLDHGGYMGGSLAEDYDLWLRLSEDPDICFHNLPLPLIGYRSNGVGEARRNVRAYASVASSQVREFLISLNPWLLMAATLTAAKRFLRPWSSF